MIHINLDVESGWTIIVPDWLRLPLVNLFFFFLGIINSTLRITKVALNIQDFAFCLVPRSVDDLFIIQDKIELLMISF